MIFDIVVLSDYVISKMKEENLLILFDYFKLLNEKYFDLCFMDLLFDDDNKYLMFYFWGMFGIIYNKEMFLDKNFDMWNVLFDFELKN